VADLRHVEAELETVRQAHYAAGDSAARQRRACWVRSQRRSEPAGERIRYVVEGRQRASSAWPSCRSRTRSGPAPPGRPTELEDLAGQIVAGRRAGRGAGRAGRRAGAGSCPRWKTPCAPRRRQQPAAQRRGAGAAADPGAGRRQPQHRRTVAPAQPRRERLAADRQGWQAPDDGAAGNCKQQEPPPADRMTWPTRACTSCRTRCRQLDDSAAPAAGAVNPKRQAGRPVARWRRCARCRKRCRPKASSSPGWPNTAWTACRACGPQVHIEPAGKPRWKPRCASAQRAGSGPPGHGARLCRPTRRRPSWPSTRAQAAIANRTRRCRAWPTCCAWAMPGLKRCWATGWRVSTPRASIDEALAQRDKLTHGEVIMTREGHAVSASSQRGLLRARLRAGRHAGARAGDRKPGPPAARAGADRRRSAQRPGAAEAAYTDASQRLLRRAAKPPRRRTAPMSCRWNCCA
jgi:chromosome segregation protein